MAAIVAAGVAVVGGVAGMIGSSKAKKARKEAARKQAAFTFSQRMEEMRRRQLGMRDLEQTAVAGAYASNLDFSGSPKQYINSLKKEHQREVQWSKYAAEQERQAIRAGGKTPGYSAAMVGQAASTISSAIGGYKAAK